MGGKGLELGFRFLNSEFSSFKLSTFTRKKLERMCFSSYQGRKQSTHCKVGQMSLVLDWACSGRSYQTLLLRWIIIKLRHIQRSKETLVILAQ